MPEIAIHDAALGDAALLADLGRRTFAEAFAGSNDPECLARFLDQTYTEDRHREELRDPAVTTLIARVDGRPAGFAQLRRGGPESCVTGPDPIELQRIYSLREFLGSGVGQALMSACLDRARTLGFRTLWLGVWEHNPRAQAFYLKHGFRQVGSHPFDVGGDLQTDLIFERAT
jgi:GNAT superfamily N-acetyltransferase